MLRVPSLSVRKIEVMWPVASSSVTIRSCLSGAPASKAWVEPSWNSSMPGSGRRSRFSSAPRHRSSRTGTLFTGQRHPAIPCLLGTDQKSVLRQPVVAEIFRQQAASPDPTTPEGLAAFVNEERQRWGEVIRAANIQLE